MIQQCLGLYPSIQVHHKQWEELLAKGYRLFGYEGGPEDAPGRGACATTHAMFRKPALLPNTSHST